MTLQKLGVFKAIHIGTTAPTNTNLIWYDDNIGQKIHKYYNTVGGTWDSLGAPVATDTTKFDTWRSSVLSATISDPSGLSPSTGDRYIIPVGAVNDWSGQDGKIATRSGSIWEYEDPIDSWGAIVADERGQLYVYETSAWIKYDLTTEGDIKSDGSVAFTGDVDLGNNKLENVATPTNGGDAANKTFVEELFSALTEIVLNDSGFTSTISTETLTGNRSINFQDKDGIIAFLSDLDIQEGVLNPIGSVTPNRSGSIYVKTDTTPKQVFIAQSTSDTSWIRLNLEYVSGNGVEVSGTSLNLKDLTGDLSLLGLGYNYVLNQLLSYTIGAQAATIDATGRGELSVSRGTVSLKTEDQSGNITSITIDQTTGITFEDKNGQKGIKITNGDNANLVWATDDDYYPTIGDIKSNTNADKTGGSGIDDGGSEYKLGNITENTSLTGINFTYLLDKLTSYRLISQANPIDASGKGDVFIERGQVSAVGENEAATERGKVYVDKDGNANLSVEDDVNGVNGVFTSKTGIIVKDEINEKGLKYSTENVNVDWSTDDLYIPDIKTIKDNIGQSNIFIDDQVNYKLTRTINIDGTITVRILVKDESVFISNLEIIPKGISNYFFFESLVSMVISNDVSVYPSAMNPNIYFNKLVDESTNETFNAAGYKIGETQTAFVSSSNDPGSPSYNANIQSPDLSTTNGGNITFTLTPVAGNFSTMTREITLKGTLFGDDY